MRQYLLLITILATLTYAKTIKTFYEDGTIKSATTYKNHKKNGVEHLFYPDGAILSYAKNYQHGKLHGLQQKYTKSAMLIQEENYKRGRLDGRSRYYENGLLKKEIAYKRGILDGEYREFYPSGTTKLEIIWSRGKAMEGYTYSNIGEKKPLSKKDLKSATNIAK